MFLHVRPIWDLETTCKHFSRCPISNFLQHYEKFIPELLQDCSGESKFSSQNISKGIKKSVFDVKHRRTTTLKTVDSKFTELNIPLLSPPFNPRGFFILLVSGPVIYLP